MSPTEPCSISMNSVPGLQMALTIKAALHLILTLPVFVKFSRTLIWF